ncbi:hypothetical protein O181_009167 [Austropuccinia psidii MF-1]|uniref:Uncharacterized protein n=1 Tax=Austropuccinia psidii MF-1 TaxID=1389203 RepID=A0A9Q3GK25_9BASI|nr:hypothetical protein [Austropuccinia psidii MF-1]
MFQWRIEHKKFKMASHWEELGARCHKICLKVIDFKEIMEIIKGWNPNRKFKLLEEREAKIRENQATIHNIEEQWRHKENILTPAGSQGVGQTNSFVASNHSESRKAGAKSHHSSQSQEVYRIRQ